MDFAPTRLPEVVLIKPRVFSDERGFFLETWQEREFARAGICTHFVQDNHSHSVRNTVRGLHYQLTHPQGKLVRVVHGAVFDVVVDMRRSSAKFGQWVGVELSAHNRCMLWVPPGFAHGYLALSETADFVYKCTDYYSPTDERAVHWQDPDIAVVWPALSDPMPLLSPRDAVAPGFRDAQAFE